MGVISDARTGEMRARPTARARQHGRHHGAGHRRGKRTVKEGQDWFRSRSTTGAHYAAADPRFFKREAGPPRRRSSLPSHRPPDRRCSRRPYTKCRSSRPSCPRTTSRLRHPAMIAPRRARDLGHSVQRPSARAVGYANGRTSSTPHARVESTSSTSWSPARSSGADVSRGARALRDVMLGAVVYGHEQMQQSSRRSTSSSRKRKPM